MGSSNFLSALTKSLSGILTTKGDVLGYGTTETRLAVGSNNQVLTADSTEALGIKWGSSGGATVTRQTAQLSGLFSTTSTSFVNITGITLTIPDNTGSFFVGLTSDSENTGNGNYNIYVFKDASTQIAGGAVNLPSSNIHSGFSSTYSGLNDGQTLLVQPRTTSGTLNLNHDATNTTRISTLEVS